MKSRNAVAASEIKIDPTQPRPLEKKNMQGASGSQAILVTARSSSSYLLIASFRT